LRDETANITGEEADALRADIDQFLAGMEPIKYACLGCDPCYPAVAENRFYTAAEGVLPLTIVQRPSCSFDVRTDGDWPIVAGEYFVLDREGSVAVSTLASTDLPEKLAQLRPRGLAIVGKTETENIGIDKVIKNIVTNPCIHTLIVAGQEPKGHMSGQALLALAENGVDERQRIIGAKGKRPFLRNVTLQEIEHFRQQVTVVDLIGCEDAERIAAEVEARAQARPCGCQGVLRQDAIMQPVPRIRAQPTQRPLKLDKAGYFVIIPQPDKGIIVVEHYDYKDRLQHIIEGEDAKTLCDTIVELGLVTQLDHAAYLGRELMRAELALRFGLPFVQDGA
jgi:tetrahydromethanopterin S-methyltransferase subunit A